MADQKAMKKRGDGPIVMMFVDAGGKLHKRVPLNVTGISIAPKGGEAKVYSLAEIPETVHAAFIASGLANRQKSYITNHGKKDGSDALSLGDEVFADVKSGKVYSKTASDGTSKQGRKFDAVIHCDAWKAAFKQMAKNGMKDRNGHVVKEMDDIAYNDMLHRLETMPLASKPDANGNVTKENMGRTDWLNSFKKNEFYVRALKDLQAKAVKVDNSKKVVDSLPF